jgi:cation transport regulator
MPAARFFSRSVASPALGRVGEVTAMPYGSNSDLPTSVQAHLPPHAQDIYREAFNHAFAAHAGDPYQEERAHRIAWAAIKRSYVKVGGSWIGRDQT